MKKILCMLMCGVLALGLAACDDAGQTGEHMWLLTQEVKYADDGTVENSRTWEYNEDGTLANTSWLNANGEVTSSRSYAYNDDGTLKLTGDIFADGSRNDKEYGYDEAGRNVSVRNWEGADEDRHLSGEIITVYEDGAKYQDSVWYDDDGAVSYTAHIVYDGQDNLLYAVNKNADGTLKGRVEWTYDEAGQNVAYRQYDGDGAVIYSYDTAYDEFGNKVRVSGGRHNENDMSEILYEYDEQGNMLRQIVKHPNTDEILDYTDYTYDEAGRKTGQIYYIGGPDAGAWADEYRYVYDENGNLQKRELVDESGRVYSSVEYSYVEVAVPTDRLAQVKEQQAEILAGM